MFKCGVCRDSIRQSAGPPFDRDVSRVDSGRFPIFEASYSSVTCSSCPMRSARDVQNRTWIQIRSVPCSTVPPAIASYLTKVLQTARRKYRPCNTRSVEGRALRQGRSRARELSFSNTKDYVDPGYRLEGELKSYTCKIAQFKVVPYRS